MGHALTTRSRTSLVRWKRMSGFNALWLPGTDHAGIATQMVVERELKKRGQEPRPTWAARSSSSASGSGRSSTAARIVEQLKRLGASLDWSRERFTLDEGLSRAVREVFVRLYEEGLIYRATRIVNWCPRCRTASPTSRSSTRSANGKLYHIDYPVTGQRRAGSRVATTRPETMLGDTAVAVHPDDARYKRPHRQDGRAAAGRTARSRSSPTRCSSIRSSAPAS